MNRSGCLSPFIAFLAVQVIFLVRFAWVQTARPAEAHYLIQSALEATHAISAPLLDQLSTLEQQIVHGETETTVLGSAATGSSDVNASESVCVVIRTFFGHTPPSMLALVSSLVNSARVANAKLRLVFADTDTKIPFVALPAIVAKINFILGIQAEISPHTYQNSIVRYPGFHDQDYGFIVTDFAMNDILRSSSEPLCKYMMLSNGDNLYARNFFRSILKELRQGADMVSAVFFPRKL